MAGLEFGDFLDKMGSETSSRKRRPEPEPIRFDEPIKEDIQPRRRKEREREIDYNDIDYNDFAEQPISEARNEPRYNESRHDEIEEPEEEMSRIDEEFKDGAYDYAQGVIKIIRQNFKSSEERVVMLEAINQAVGYYLQSLGGQQQPQYQSITHTTQAAGPSSAPHATMSESAWNNIPTNSNGMSAGGMQDLTGQTVQIQPQMAPTGDYKSELKLGIKIAADGKQEADLSGVTASDINEMRVLAGMIGPEAEAKARELAGAKQAVHEQMMEKNSRGGE